MRLKIDIDKGVKFETYAYIRIRGTVRSIKKIRLVAFRLKAQQKIEAAYDDLKFN